MGKMRVYPASLCMILNIRQEPDTFVYPTEYFSIVYYCITGGTCVLNLDSDPNFLQIWGGFRFCFIIKIIRRDVLLMICIAVFQVVS